MVQRHQHRFFQWNTLYFSSAPLFIELTQEKCLAWSISDLPHPHPRDTDRFGQFPTPGLKGRTCPGGCPGGMVAGGIEPCISAALYRGRRLFEGDAYWKTGSYKEIFSFNLKVYLLSVWKIAVSNRSVFLLSAFTFFGTFQWCLHSTQISLPFYNNPFLKERHSSVSLYFLYSGV